MKAKILVSTLAAVLIAALALLTLAGPAETKHRSKPTATPVFKLFLVPWQEVPPIKGLRAAAVGNVTFDLTRDKTGAITAGEAIFYFNYRFPETVTITGLHVHVGDRGENGGIVIDSGLAAFEDPDGKGNVTTVVPVASPQLLQDILNDPRGYYVNLHTSEYPAGALRDQLERPKRW
jgi:hypothetical protein